MAPFYTGWTPNLALSKDDILAIQALYGPNVNEVKYNPGLQDVAHSQNLIRLEKSVYRKSQIT